MSAAPGVADLERFRAAVTRLLGLAVDDARLPQLAEVLQARARAARADVPAYVDRFERGAGREEIVAVGGALTISETYFFRNIEQFHALREVVLPERSRAAGGGSRLRILSAGCASGEEAHSLAICAAELLPGPPWRFTVRGVDISPAMVERARAAAYAAWALRETPPEVMARWFRPSAPGSRPDDALRETVEFEVRNLAEEDGDLWAPGAYDVVFCRNVLMYFSPEAARRVVARAARSLRPGGYLFLGHAETLRGLSDAFHLCHTHGTFYYRVRGAGEGAVAPPAPAAGSRSTTREPDPVPPPEPGAWPETIRRAADRVRALTARSVVPAAAPFPRAVAGGAGAAGVAVALDLLREERFGPALDLVRSLPESPTGDPDVLLLHAVLLAQAGALAEAEAMCRRVLAADEFSAGAHYLLALCREGAGDDAAAATHDRTAAYLDPGFAMPRLHMGLLARKRGDVDAARRELEAARMLLRTEDSSRLLLFGGGFGRDALVAVCEAEARACGGAA